MYNIDTACPLPARLDTKINTPFALETHDTDSKLRGPLNGQVNVKNSADTFHQEMITRLFFLGCVPTHH